jgi:hypothetical protein
VKVLFTADLHIKTSQKGVPVEWSKNRYRLLFQELALLSKDVHLTVLGGDIFDKIPNIEELELYFELVKDIQSDCVIYSGNHEAVKKNTTFLTNLKDVTQSLNYNVEIIDDYMSYMGIDFIPYNKLKEWEKNPDNTLHNNVLCTHVRGNIEPHVKAEVDLSLFERWKTVLAGDLHSYNNSQRNILYPGSPVTTSFHRNLVDTGVIIFDTVTHTHEWIKLDLPQLLRKTIKAGDPMVATDFHHTIYEIEGTMDELSDVEHSDLLDKKVSKKNTDTTLILDPTMTISDEVEEYARYVLQLNESAITAMLNTLNQHIGELQ